MLGLAAPSIALALRPFDGTDASVAAPGEFELELGPLQTLREGPERSRIHPAVVANWGLANDREVVLEGRVRTVRDPASGSRTRLEDDALSLKQGLRPGSLQDQAGVSIVNECGVLLPTVHAERGVGATCAMIFSQRFEPAALHLNLGLTRTRTHSMGRFASLIVEGRSTAPVRPVAEIVYDRESGAGAGRSALMGGIWQVSTRLSLDVAVRVGRSDGQRVQELRAGLTWTTPS